MKQTPTSTRETTIPLVFLAGDTLAAFAGLSACWWLRYAEASPLAHSVHVKYVAGATFREYLPLLLVGVALLIGAFTQFGLYNPRNILRRYQSLNVIIKGSAIWLAAYLGISLVLKFEPAPSRLFVFLSLGVVLPLLVLWRALAQAVIKSGPILESLRRRTVLLGWNEQAQSLAADIGRDPAHPFEIVGVVLLGTETGAPWGQGAPPRSEVERVDPNALVPGPGPGRPAMLGTVADLESILPRVGAQLVIATRLDIPRDQVKKVIETCERAYVDWKVVPAAFDIFLTGLRLQTIGRVPVLGVEELAIARLFNRMLKRAIDVVGAAIGLVVSFPLMAVLAALIRRESPGAPAIFRQERVGTGHRLFTLFKLRSMAPDAASADHARQSTAREDPRLLRIGAFLRRWNLDELPQFWNVLRGEMSLVGPRPERPHHVDQLALTIPHYLPRHVVKPGMTGWAQVNGFRGESDLSARVQHDIYYIENWSLWLDIQIILLTFVRWRSPNAY